MVKPRLNLLRHLHEGPGRRRHGWDPLRPLVRIGIPVPPVPLEPPVPPLFHNILDPYGSTHKKRVNEIQLLEQETTLPTGPCHPTLCFWRHYDCQTLNITLFSELAVTHVSTYCPPKDTPWFVFYKTVWRGFVNTGG